MALVIVASVPGMEAMFKCEHMSRGGPGIVPSGAFHPAPVVPRCSHVPLFLPRDQNPFSLRSQWPHCSMNIIVSHRVGMAGVCHCALWGLIQWTNFCYNYVMNNIVTVVVCKWLYYYIMWSSGIVHGQHSTMAGCLCNCLQWTTGTRGHTVYQ